MIKVGSNVITIFSSRYRQGRRCSSFLSKVVLSLCCIISVYCDQKQWSLRVPRGIEDLKRVVLNKTPSLIFLGNCDFEGPCDWYWNETTGFRLITSPAPSEFGPKTDASAVKNGKLKNGKNVDYLHLESN